MSAAAVIMRRRKKFIRRFREKGATSRECAIAFSEVRMRRSWIFEKMVRQGVFISVGGDRYFMDEQAADHFLRAQRARALSFGCLLIILFVVYLILAAVL